MSNYQASAYEVLAEMFAEAFNDLPNLLENEDTSAEVAKTAISKLDEVRVSLRFPLLYSAC